MMGIFRREEHIDDEDDLYRRIPPSWYNEKEDRVSSAAFNRDLNLSVNWSKYSTPQETVKGLSGYHVAALQAKVPRANRQQVLHAPSKKTRAHSLIIGEKPLSIARVLARNCRFVLKNTNYL